MKKLAALLIVALLLALAFTVLAQSGYSLTWWTVGGGGGTSAMGEYVVGGTIGQAEAGPAMSGGDYTLGGGFWVAEAPPAADQALYLPMIIR